jgi:nicotinate-nucleotide pyrophosphorylase (carboxylating)
MRENLNDSRVSRLIEEAIIEDIGMGDVTTEAIVPVDLLGRGDILVKESGIIAGLEIARLVFQYIDPQVTLKPLIADGSWIEAPTVIANVNGPLASILKGERTALNFLQRMSGIATLTRKFVDAVKGTGTKITDTRKTAPTLRIIDKLAVQIGGGVNHRFGLDDMVLIKDNHIAAAGGITEALKRCQQYLSTGTYKLKVEVEAKNLDEVREALKSSGVHRIMLDNFSGDEMKEAVQIINHAVEVEASGNVSLTNVRAIAETGVDFISIGALTHSPKALDISLEVAPPPVRTVDSF